MDLRKAYETLGLEEGASPDEVEAAYAELREEVEARLAHTRSAALTARYREVRARLDAAREWALMGPSGRAEPLAEAFSLLGLSPDASPLDVASAYVSLCEEIDREVEDAPSEAMRRACLQARADVDAAYQRCAVSPLRDAPPPTSTQRGPAVRYETQMSAEPFEAPERPEALEPVLRIDPDEPSLVRSRRSGGRGLRWAAVLLVLLLLAAGLATGAAWWSGIDLREAVHRYVPTAVVNRLVGAGEPEALIEARTTAESLRRRIAEERVELQARIDEAQRRVERLEASWSSAEDPAERERMAQELDLLRSRRALAVEHAALAERHVLTSGAIAEIDAGLTRAGELARAARPQRAIAAYAGVEEQLEAALAMLDRVEEAVGARSEAVAGLDAWRVLVASADLEELPAAAKGAEVLDHARQLLADGDFAAAVPELRRASQHFAAALAEGRKLAALARSQAEEQAVAAPDPPLDVVSAPVEPPERVAPPPAPASSPSPPVSAPPPSLERAAIKLVLVPAGDFVYGCSGGLEAGCPTDGPVARRVALDAFRIDRTEVRVDEYRACVEAGACTPPDASEGCNWNVPERGDHPVNCVDWQQAGAYCGWVGKRLPLEREWEKAARGTDGRRYPWGDEDASCTTAVIAAGGAPGCGRGSTSPVASRAEGRSPFGLFDMAGNVLEWTGDAAESGVRIARGGSWREDASPARATHRAIVDGGRRDAGIGFRCAQGPGLYAVSAP